MLDRKGDGSLRLGDNTSGRLQGKPRVRQTRRLNSNRESVISTACNGRGIIENNVARLIH